ncbi:MAG: RNA polymerase sigma factor [Microthrixaceae bacterium]
MPANFDGWDPGAIPADWRIASERSTRAGSAASNRRRLDRDLDALIDEHAEAAFRVANGILRNPSLAEDAVQETMIKAWQSLERFRGDSSLRSWVLSIAHNTSISMLRRRREAVMAPEDMPEIPGGIDPARSSSAMADLRAVRSALEDLDELSRSIVVFREVEGMSYQEIAETLRVPVPTVKTRLLRARKRLAEAIGSAEDHL